MSDEGIVSTILADEHDSKHLFLGIEVANHCFPLTLGGIKANFLTVPRSSTSPDPLRPRSPVFLILFTLMKVIIRGMRIASPIYIAMPAKTVPLFTPLNRTRTSLYPSKAMDPLQIPGTGQFRYSHCVEEGNIIQSLVFV